MAPAACAVGTDMVVLALKKCISGPPLLPVLGASGSWESWHNSSAPLAEYLYELLQRLGVPVPVLNHIGGRALAVYQAAVRREDWMQVKESVAGALKQQRTAYRVQNQGPGSPHIAEAAEPRFADGCSPAMGGKSCNFQRPPPGLELTLPLSTVEPLKVVLGIEWARSLNHVRSGDDVDSDSASTTLDDVTTCISDASSESDAAFAFPMRLLRSEAGQLFATRL